MGRGLAAPFKNPTPVLGPSGLISTGLRVEPITEMATLLMIDFKCRPIYEVRIFSVSENGENRLGDEGLMGAMLPRIFGLEPPMRLRHIECAKIK